VEETIFPKFKVNDKVKLCKTEMYGTILEVLTKDVSKAGWHYLVNLDNGITLRVKEQEIKKGTKT